MYNLYSLKNKSSYKQKNTAKEDKMRSRSRWSRYHESMDDYNRDHGRSHRRDYKRNNTSDSENSECSVGGCLGASVSEVIGYKSAPPSNTVVIKELASHITENDIRRDVVQCGVMPKEIRLIRRKDTGASRGFAFIDFATVEEATRWVKIRRGVLVFQNQYRAIMNFTTRQQHDSHKPCTDWFCVKCSSRNFKHREQCFQCNASRKESEEGGSGSDEICSYATKTLMLRNLDTLTTADIVMNELNNVIPNLIKKISAVAIGKDVLTLTSRGICYLGTDAAIDAMELFNALNSLAHPLTIEGKAAILSYCKYNMGDMEEKHNEPESTYKITNNSDNCSTQEINSVYSDKQISLCDTIPDGTEGKRYPTPDVSKYIYDPTSGFYYDPQTRLYYEQNSQYYWNSNIHKYLYWHREKSTYLLVPTYNATTEVPKKKGKTEKQLSVAKMIGKDMERWARMHNEKQEIQPPQMNKTSSTADIGYNILKSFAAYDGDSSSSEEEETNDYLDFDSLICKLCRRMLPNAVTLMKHAQLSEIHKEKLEQLKSKKRSAAGNYVYRDRAKERRERIAKEKRKLKEIQLASVENRLLGQRLGKAEPTTNSVGSETGETSASCKDSVKKRMWPKYRLLFEKEN